MVLNEIEKLIEKYENGETSIKEEQQLRDYFAKDNVPAHLEAYRSMFAYFVKTKSERYTKEVPFSNDKHMVYKLTAVAAALLITFGVWFNQSGPSELEQKQAMLAYTETMQALGMVSNQLNEGKEKLSPLNVLNTNLNEGMQKANLIKEFSETTNIVYNTSNN